jgi:small subunit ribosomal protein S6
VKRPYESMIVLDGSLPDDIIQKEQKQIEELLKQNASFEKTDVWGKRVLAYTIRKKKTGIFCLFLFEGEGSAVIALDKYVKLNTNVLRHLTVVRNLKNEAARAIASTRKERIVPDSDIDMDDDQD